MIGRMMMYYVACFLPWAFFLTQDKPGAAVAAFLLQTTVIGWIPASIWAVRVLRDSEKTPGKKKSNKHKENHG